MQQVVGEVAFGIDQDGGDALQCGLFEQDNTHTRFTRACHAGDHGMRGEIAGVVEGEFIGDNRFGGEVVSLTEIKF